jgi:hypothetical protein
VLEHWVYIMDMVGIHHGYGIQCDDIWKSTIEKMKCCIHVWKSRNLTYGGKSLIIKNVLLYLCGYEIEREFLINL